MDSQVILGEKSDDQQRCFFAQWANGILSTYH